MLLARDGGPGWVWPVPPHRYVKHQIVSTSPVGDWTIWSASLSPVGDGLHGVAGGSEQTVGGSTVLSSKTAFTDAGLDAAAGLPALEVLTPLNKTVGVGK